MESEKTKQMSKENKTHSNRLVVVKGKEGSGVSEKGEGVNYTVTGDNETLWRSLYSVHQFYQDSNKLTKKLSWQEKEVGGKEGREEGEKVNSFVKKGNNNK